MAVSKALSSLLLCTAAAAGVSFDPMETADGMPLMRKEVRAHPHTSLAQLDIEPGNPVDRASLQRFIEHARLQAGYTKDVHPDKADAFLQAHVDVHTKMNATWNYSDLNPLHYLPSLPTALAYRHTYFGLLINPLFLLHEKDMKDRGWKSTMQISVNDFPGSDFAEVWKDSKQNCIVAFRGSEDLWDFINDIRVNPVEYMGLKDVGESIKNEFDGLFAKIKEMNMWQHLHDCTHLAVTGHSLGGAVAAIFAALANKHGDPLGAGLKVDYLYQFGPIPSAATPLSNDQSPDGCFEGTRFYNLIYGAEGSITDFAVWVGSKFSTSVGGEMQHARVKAIGRDASGLNAEELTCEEAPAKPAKNDHQDFMRNELNIPLHLPQLYITSMWSTE